MKFMYFKPPVQNQKFPSTNANVPLQPKVTTSFEMIFHFLFCSVQLSSTMCSSNRRACLQGMVMPCPLRISSSCKEEVISKANSTSPFASWRRLVLEALDDRKHADMAKQESVHMHPSEDFLLLSTLHGKCKLCLMHFFRSNTASLCINSS